MNIQNIPKQAATNSVDCGVFMCQVSNQVTYTYSHKVFTIIPFITNIVHRAREEPMIFQQVSTCII